MKRIILSFILIVSISGLYSQETSSTNPRKGVHLGFHFTPGYGTIFTNAYDNLAIDFGMTAGLDVNVYFSDLLGIHTGVTYLDLPWRYKFEIGDRVEGKTKEVTASVKAIGIPAKFLLTTGKKTVGFYLEAGLTVYFPVSYTSDPDRGILKTSTAMVAPEITAGINIRATDLISFNVSAFSSSQMPVFSNTPDPSFGVLYGVKLGMMFHLSK